MILGTHRKTSTWRSRTAAAVMIIGAATLSAPLIQADAHPEMEVSEEELAGKYTTHQGKSVIKREYNDNGKTISEHFEINVDGDDIKAFKVEPSGKRVRINVEDIDGVDVRNVTVENIEGVSGNNPGNSRIITISDGEDVKVMSRDDFKKWAETEYPEWKENDFASWAKGDFEAWASKGKKGKVLQWDKEGSKKFGLSTFPKSSRPSRFSKNSENVFVIESDTFEGLEGLAGLKALEGLEGLRGLEGLKALEGLKGLGGLEKLKALRGLESLEGLETFTFSTDDGNSTTLKLRLTESKLAAARAMLEDTEIASHDSREMAKAKRELEKARKALRAAERALQDAE